MARDRTRIRLEPMIAFGVPVYGGAMVPTVGQDWFVDPNADVFVPKKQSGSGKSDDRPFATLEEALSACNTGDRIFIHGDIREEGLICSNLKFDVHIIGVGSRHHPDQPSSAYHPGAAMIRPPASPTAATDLLELRGRGWQFHNIAFDCPVDAAAIKIVENGSSGTDEYAGSHATFRDILFRNGQYGVELDGAGHNITWIDCEFFLMNNSGNTGAGIIQTSTAQALGFKNRVIRCDFIGDSSIGGNDRHIVAAWQSSVIRDSTFGKVEGTGRYIDLNGGNDNVVTRNTLGGTYDTDDYRAGTDDIWVGNYSPSTAETEVGDNGITVAAPAAP